MCQYLIRISFRNAMGIFIANRFFCEKYLLLPRLDFNSSKIDINRIHLENNVSYMNQIYPLYSTFMIAKIHSSFSHKIAIRKKEEDCWK